MESAAKIFLSFLLILTTPIYAADCPQAVQVVKQGQQVNCSGFLFSHDAEQQAEQNRNDATFYKSYSDKLNEKIKLQTDEIDTVQKRVNLYQQEANNLNDRLAKEDNNESLYRFAYFVLGVVLTGLVVRNVRQ